MAIYPDNLYSGFNLAQLTDETPCREESRSLDRAKLNRVLNHEFSCGHYPRLCSANFKPHITRFFHLRNIGLPIYTKHRKSSKPYRTPSLQYSVERCGTYSFSISQNHSSTRKIGYGVFLCRPFNYFYKWDNHSRLYTTRT